MKLFTKRNFLKTAVAGGVAGVASSIYGFYVEPDRLVVNEQTLYVKGLPGGMDGLTVLQMTDFHYDKDTDYDLIQKLVAEVNALAPDVIVFTGDYITGDMRSFDFLIEALDGITAKLGMFAILGNHDGWHGNIEVMKKAFTRLGADFLVNQNTRILAGGESLPIVGTDFIWLGKPDLASSFKGVKAGETSLALVHEPDFFDQVKQHHSSFVQLSGHTHGGQCRVPLVGYAPVTVKYGRKYVMGSFGTSEQQLFVSSGVGTTGIRVRFACPPELALLTLKASD